MVVCLCVLCPGNLSYSFFIAPVQMATIARLLAWNFLFKVSGFISTILLTRGSAPAVKGFYFLQEMYANTAVFIAREAVRAGAIRRFTEDDNDHDEGIRKVASSSSSSADELIPQQRMRHAALMGWLCPVVALPVAIATGVWFASSVPSSEADGSAEDADGATAVRLLTVCLFSVGVFLECLTEPLQSVMIALGDFQPKMASEAVAILARVLTAHCCFSASRSRVASRGDVVDAWSSSNGWLDLLTDPASLSGGKRTGLVMCFAQAVQGLALALSITIVAWPRLRRRLQQLPSVADARSAAENRLSPKPVAHLVAVLANIFSPVSTGTSPSSCVHVWRKRCHLYVQFLGDGLLRLALTEGEKFVLSIYVRSMASLGIYDLISRIGSLAARFIFRVWEDYQTAAWSRMPPLLPGDDEAPRERETATAHNNAITATTTADSEGSSSTEPGGGATAMIARSSQLSSLRAILRLAVLFGLFSATFGPPLSHMVLLVLYSHRWCRLDAIYMLQQYLRWLLPLMAVNGLLEAFCRSSLTHPGTQARVRWGLTACSIVCVVLNVMVFRHVEALTAFVIPGELLRIGQDDGRSGGTRSAADVTSVFHLWCSVANFSLRILLSLTIITGAALRAAAKGMTKRPQAAAAAGDSAGAWHEVGSSVQLVLALMAPSPRTIGLFFVSGIAGYFLLVATASRQPADSLCALELTRSAMQTILPSSASRLEWLFGRQWPLSCSFATTAGASVMLSILGIATAAGVAWLEGAMPASVRIGRRLVERWLPSSRQNKKHQ